MHQAVWIQNVQTLSYDPKTQRVEQKQGQQLVSIGNRLVYVGASVEVAKARLLEGIGQEQFDLGAYRLVHGQNKVVLPGFANPHSHIAMTLLRNLADDLALHDWLFQSIFPREAKLDAAMTKAGAKLGMVELLESGCTLATDMYMFSEAILEGANELGFRLNAGIGVGGRTEEGEYHLDEAEAIIEQLKASKAYQEGLGHRLSLIIHSVYLLPEWAYPRLADLAKKHDLAIQVHISETIKENEDCQAKYGCSPCEFLEKAGVFDVHCVAAHCVHLSDKDKQILAKYGVHVVHNPASNLKLASGVAAMQELIDRQISVSLGTDGPASNNKLDYCADLRLAALLGKIPGLNPTALSAETVFLMATKWGYEASQFPEGGYLAEGALADFQIWNYEDSAGFCPVKNLLSAVVYSADRSLVDEVYVNGVRCVEGGRVTTLERQAIIQQAQAYADVLNEGY